MIQKNDIKGKPFIKWAGGKVRLLETILENLPPEFDTYYEPFLGSGALFFAIQPTKAVLSDINDELIVTYKEVKHHASMIIEKLSLKKNNEENFYKIRAWKPKKDIDKAVRFLYLNKLCYNGMYRVNKKGEFNVPFCKDVRREIYNRDRIERCSLALTSAEILACDFEEQTDKIKKGDFVYIDPPYAVQKKNNGFLEYNKKIFHWQDQIRLAKFASLLNKRGAYILISNVNVPEVIDLYPDFKVSYAVRKCNIGGKNAERKSVQEILLKNY